MADRSDGMCGPSGAPRLPRNRPPRNRRRWIAAAVAVAMWVFLLAYTRSLVAGTALLLLLAVFVTLCTVAVRGLGITSDQHSGSQRTAARQWRDGRDALAHGLRRLADVAAMPGPRPVTPSPGLATAGLQPVTPGPRPGLPGPRPGLPGTRLRMPSRWPALGRTRPARSTRTRMTGAPGSRKARCWQPEQIS